MKKTPIRFVPEALSLALLLAASGASAQAHSGAVLPAGGVRVDVAGHFSHFNVRRVTGGTEPADAWFRRLVDAEVEEAGAGTGALLESFFAGTGGVQPGGAAADAIVGTADLGFHNTTREVPVRLAVGLFPRVELTVALPFERDEVLLQRYWLAGGNLGTNPDPVRNAQILASIDDGWAALGSAGLLPVEDTPLGILLAERVLALTGQELSLPAEAVGATFLGDRLGAAGLTPPLSGVRPWRTGDLEVGARLRVLSTFGDLAYPEASAGTGVRLTVAAAARLPTGQEVEPEEPFTQLASVGHTGFRLGADADIFIGRRAWLSAGGEMAHRSGGDSAAGDETEPLQAIVWSPASEMALRLTPRFRLTDLISFGGRYEMLRSGSERREVTTPTAAFALVTPAGSLHRLGFEVRYTSLPQIGALPGRLRGPLAMEAGLAYLQTVAGPAGAPAPGTVVIQASILHRLWGGN